MIQVVDVRQKNQLKDYANYVHLSKTVEDLRSSAKTLVPKLNGHKVWMVNSTADGGGVAEMIPKMIGLMKDLGVDAEWVVVNSDERTFFTLTKRLHNLIHDFGPAGFSATDVKLYQRVSQNLADELTERIAPEDILVVHDPQPLGAGAEVKRRTGVRAIWRCHIGLGQQTAATASAWRFLKTHAQCYDHAIFSTPEYIPSYLRDKASVIHPAIDPLSDKNRELSVQELGAVLLNAGLMKNGHHPGRRWKYQARRLQPDGNFAPAHLGQDIGLLFFPIVTQVSRWDRLKGWESLLNGFVYWKRNFVNGHAKTSRRYASLTGIRLLMVGPDPSAVQDDPEGLGVLNELREFYRSLSPQEQDNVVLLTLPMVSREQNHLMVNVLQRCSTLVVQNSLQEGFGLTATEAMWKRLPVLGTVSGGLRRQIRDRVDGLLTQDPQDPREIAANLDEMLTSRAKRERWGRNAQRRVHDQFLMFTQVRQWLHRLAEIAERPVQVV